MDEKQQEQVAKDPLEGCPENLLPVLKGIKSVFKADQPDYLFFRDEATVTVSPEKVLELLTYLKDKQGFGYMIDLGGLHTPGQENEFEVFYNLLNIEDSRKIRIKTWAGGDDLKVPTSSKLWEAANWHEREAYDMYGIIFEGHPDLRRMFLPENVKIHPLRKDYPLRGDNDKPTW